MVCEGEVTEPQYLRGLERSIRNATIQIEIRSDRRDPLHLVQRAERMMREAERAARQERDEFRRYDEVWCVCDKDRHERLDEARRMARQNGIHLVVSNPCFELWLLLHFRDPPGQETGATILGMLRRHLPEYEKHLEFQHVADGVAKAIERAERLHAQAEEDGEEGRNPSTDVFRLARSILRTDP